FKEALPSLLKSGSADKTVAVQMNGDKFNLAHGSVVISAITSCTNTSNPSVLIAAGLLAKKATEKGLKPKPWVKTSLAPGSRVVTEYLKDSGLRSYLKDIWPPHEEINDTMRKSVRSEMFKKEYSHATEGDDRWNTMPVPEGELFQWDMQSTYVRQAPYFEGMTKAPSEPRPITGARC